MGYHEERKIIFKTDDNVICHNHYSHQIKTDESPERNIYYHKGRK